MNTDHSNSPRSGAAIVAFIGLLTVAMLAALLASSRYETAVQVAPQSGRTQAQGVDPCAHLNYNTWESGYNDFIMMSVGDIASLAHVVAEVSIAEIDTSRFDTPSGDPPTALPTTATDEEHENYNHMIVAPVVLDATNIYSGTSVTGYVVLRVGGSSSACPEYAYNAVDEISGEVDDVGIVELRELPASWSGSPPNWFAHLTDKADELNADPNVNYEPMLLVNWYRFTGDDAVSTSLITPMPVDDLEAALETATAP